MKMVRVLAIAAAASALAASPAPVRARSCDNPLQDNLLFGVQAYADDTTYYNGMSLPEYICCNNERWAEHSGFQDDAGVDFFGRLEAAGAADAGAPPTTFYDSTCGLPLFVAPVGRTFAEWRTESRNHGWPSFRDDELVDDNIRVKSGGEVRSTCGTHLGHNLPDSSGNRYCIDLVCMAGHPAANSSSSSSSSSGGGAVSTSFGSALPNAASTAQAWAATAAAAVAGAAAAAGAGLRQ